LPRGDSHLPLRKGKERNKAGRGVDPSPSTLAHKLGCFETISTPGPPVL
jgi:hypothetical protein